LGLELDLSASFKLALIRLIKVSRFPAAPIEEQIDLLGQR
jgi:hypothetical protein